MKKFSSVWMLILIVIIFSSNSAPAYDKDEKVISRIDNLINTYGKKTIVHQLIENKDKFTININNQLIESPHPLSSIDEKYIDADSIYYDMTRYKVTIDELEKKFKIETARIEEDAKAEKLKKAKVISRIDNLITAYGKKTILYQIIEKENDSFTIHVNNTFISENNRFIKQPILKEGDNDYYEKNIDAHSIYMDMESYQITIDELEERLIKESARLEAEAKAQKIADEKAALEKKRLEEEEAEAKAQKIADEKAALEKKRLEEKALLQKKIIDIGFKILISLGIISFIAALSALLRKKEKWELLLINIKKIFLFPKKTPFVSVIVLLFIFFGITFGYLYYQKKEQQQQQQQLQQLQEQQQLQQLQEQQQKELYLTKLHLAISLIPISATWCNKMCETYSTAWNKAIEDQVDFNTALSLTHALADDLGDINQIERQKKDIESILKNLNALPDYLPEVHKKTIEFFGIYAQLSSLAINPSGSLMSYNNKVHELQSNLVSKSNELQVSLPQNEKINEAVSILVKDFISNELKSSLKQREKENEMVKRIKAATEELDKKIQEKNRE